MQPLRVERSVTELQVAQYCLAVGIIVLANLTIIDGHLRVAAYMTVLTAAIDAGINLRFATIHIFIIIFVVSEIGTCLTDGDIRLVDVAGVECRTIKIALTDQIGRKVWRSFTGTATEDVTAGQLALHAHFRICFVYVTDNTAQHLHSGLTAAEEVVCIVWLV